MRYPKFLKKNGTIGFVAPSLGCNTEPYKSAFNHAQKKLQSLGHKLDVAPNCYEYKGVALSNTPENCGKELTEYYCSEKNEILISVGGGELMCTILDYVDFEKIAASKPKWYMGYSDNTNFTFLLPTLCDVASIYGPNAGTFGMEPWHESVQHAYDLLVGFNTTSRSYEYWETRSLKSPEKPLEPYNVTEKSVKKYWIPDEMKQSAGNEKSVGADHCGGGQMIDGPDFQGEISMEGRLIGGCMDCLDELVGTNYDKVAEFCQKYKEDGVIWFLEACELSPLAIKRTLWHMDHADWFKTCKGFIIGRPMMFGETSFGLDQYAPVTDILAKYNVPIIMDADIGHCAPMMPLVCGSYAKISAKGNDIAVEMCQR